MHIVLRNTVTNQAKAAFLLSTTFGMLFDRVYGLLLCVFTPLKYKSACFSYH